MPNLNKAALMGHVGKDPEVRTMPNGGSVANLTLATTEKWKDKNSGEHKEKTEWHRVVFFNRLAEIVQQYVNKGDPIYVEGSIRTQKWKDNSGNDRYTTEIVAREMQMLSRGGKNEKGQTHQQSQKQHPSQAKNMRSEQEQLDGAFDDEIPF